MIEVTRGFLSEFTIDMDQRESFALAPARMSLMLGIRFLTDHFADDVYFKVDSHGENLERAREQFKLAKVFEDLVPKLLDEFS